MIFRFDDSKIKNVFNGFSFTSSFTESLNADIASLTKLTESAAAFNDFDQIMKDASASAVSFAKSEDFCANNIAKFALEQRKSQVTLQAQNISFKNAIGFLREYNSSVGDANHMCSNAQMSQADFVSSIKESNHEFGSYLEGLNGGKASIGGYVASLFSAKLATIGLEIATVALNAAISFGISFAISGAIKLLDNWVHAEERAIEAGKKAAQSIKDIQSTLRNTVSLIEDNKQRFAELAQNVDLATGKNKGLTNDEYKEFLDISNQLAETFPTLTRNYDENGNAIVQLGGDVDTVVGSLEALLETERKLKQQEIVDHLPDLYKGKATEVNQNLRLLNVDTKDYKYGYTKASGANQHKEHYEKYLEELENADVINAIKEAYKKYGEKINLADILTGDTLNYDFEAEFFGQLKKEAFKNSDNADEFIDAVVNYTRVAFNEANVEIKKVADKNKVIWSDVISGVFAWFESDDNFLALSDGMRKLMTSVVNGLDYSKLNNGKPLESFSELQDYFKKTLLPIFQADESGDNNFQGFINIQTQYNGNDCSVGEYRKSTQAITDYIDSLDGVDDETKKNIKIALQIDEESTNDFNVQYDRLLKKVSENEDNPLRQKFKGWVDSLNASDLKILTSIQLDTTDWDLSDWKQYLEGHQKLEFKLDISAETEGMQTVLSALNESANSATKESASAIGLSTESINALKSRYSTLADQEENLADLFENTSQGIHINRKALGELEKAYASQNRAKLLEKLEEQKKKYNQLSKDIQECGNSQEDFARKQELLSEKSALKTEIENTAILISQYEALTSSYNEFVNARSGTDDRDMYSNLAEGYKEVKELLDSGWANDSEVNAYLDTMLNADQRTRDNIADFQKLKETIDGTHFNITDFFQYDDNDKLVSDGLFNFLDAVHDVLGEEYVQITKDANGEASYSWDLTGQKAEEVAQKLGMSAEAVGILQKALTDVTDNITLDSLLESLDGLVDSMDERVSSLKEALGEDAGKYKLEFDFGSFDTTDLESQITNIRRVIVDNFKDADGNINLNVDGAQEALEILASLVARKQELTKPDVMRIDTDKLDGRVKETIGSLQELQNGFDNLNLVGDYLQQDTSEIQSHIQEIVKTLDSLPKETKQKLNLDTEEAKTAIETIKTAKPNIEGKLSIPQSAINTLKKTIAGIDTEVFISSFKIDPSAIEDYKANDHNIVYTVNSKEVDNLETRISKYCGKEKKLKFGVVKTTELKNLFDTQTIKRTMSVNIVYNDPGVKVSSSSGSGSGTVKATSGNKIVKGGTLRATMAQGTAFLSGTWGTKTGGVAIGGEIAPELLIRNGRFYTIGDNSAELFHYQPGDIIFNAEQTRQIFANGKITNGQKRGVSYSGGTAFATGSSGTTKRITSSGSTKSVSSASSASSSGSSSSSSSNTSSSNTSSSRTDNNTSEEAEKTAEALDWVEISLERIKRTIDNLATKAKSTFKSLATRLGATNDEISEINAQINLNQRAAERYMQEANNVGLSAELAEMVRNGAIDIEEYDSETKKLIDDYKKWYDKSLDCADAVSELHEELASLYEDNFNNVKKNFDNQLSLLEHLSNTYNTGIDMLEAKGYMASTQYYTALKNATQQNISVMNQQLSAMEQKMAEALASGEIEMYSESWYNMAISINDVKENIAEANVELVKFDKTIREIEWERFEYLQDRISQITQESDFLIDLLQEKTQYDENGRFNRFGISSVGLHAANYNVYMSQADKYANEIVNINRELANDPYNTDLIKHREDLLKLQQDSIKAAGEEKKAIADLVKGGIDIELDKLKELIDNYGNALDSTKDLYDYQKKVSSKSNEISSLQKQIAAYSGDDSEETRSTVQKLQKDLTQAREDLEQTQYEQFISDQKKLLDELYSEYEGILNERVDDIDVLIEDMIDAVNTNSATINSTIGGVANEVGYTLTPQMQAIWDGSTNAISGVVAKYGDGFSGQNTAIKNVLDSIAVNVANLVAASEQEAARVVSQTTSTPQAATGGNQTPVQTQPSTQPSSSSRRDEQENYGVALAIINGNYGWGTGETRKNNLRAKGFDAAHVQDIVNKLIAEGYVPNGSWQGRYYGIRDLSPYGINKFKQGGLVDYTGLAQLDGTKTKPEMVLNPTDTANFVSLRDTLRAMSSKTLTGGLMKDFADSPKLNGVIDMSEFFAGLRKTNHEIQGTTVGDIHINIPIERVMDYNDFMRQLQRDDQFEEFVRSFTIDPLTGKNSIEKYKYRW